MINLAAKLLGITNLILLLNLSNKLKISHLAFKFFIFVFIALCLLSTPLFYFSLIEVDYGINFTPRFSGIFMDANYFAYFCLVLYVVTSKVAYRVSRGARVILLLFIFLSQSFSGLFLLFLYKATITNILSRYKKILFFTPFIFLFLVVNTLGNLTVFDNWQENFFAMKANSALFRFFSVFKGYQLLIEDNFRLFFGFGSGLSDVLIGRVMHNSIIQVFFDHGLFGLTSLYIYLSVAFRYTYYKELFVITFLFGFLFDPLWVYGFSILPIFCCIYHRDNLSFNRQC
jgi:hypothetical protein